MRGEVKPASLFRVEVLSRICELGELCRSTLPLVSKLHRNWILDARFPSFGEVPLVNDNLLLATSRDFRYVTIRWP